MLHFQLYPLNQEYLVKYIALTKLLTYIFVHDYTYLKGHLLTISKLQTDIF